MGIKKRVIGISIFAVIIILLAAGTFFYLNLSKTTEFTKTSLIRMNIPLGGGLNTSIKITNAERNIQTLQFAFNDFDDLASLSDSSFVLQPGESKNLMINFLDNKGIPGVYVGKLIIESSAQREEIPIILGVEDPNHAFAIIQSVIPKYDTVYPGEKFGIDIKVFDLVNSNVQAVKSDYVIKNLDDEIMLNGNTDLVVESGSRTEIINIPEEWETGDYVFISNINYKDTVSFSSYLFTISNPSDKGIISGNSETFFIIVIFFVVLVLGLVIYFIITRDSLLVQLKKQQAQELKRSLKCLDYSKKSIEKTELKPEKKKEKLRKLVKIKKSVIQKIKAKQEKQKKEISHLKRKKTEKTVLQKKLEAWKKEGYNLNELNKGVKEMHNKNIKSQIDDWKNQGYDVSFLNK